MPSVSFPGPPGPARIYLYCRDFDMRRSLDGLHAIVQFEFRRNIRLGDWFLFLNRRLDPIKLLHSDRDGMAVWIKKLEYKPPFFPLQDSTKFPIISNEGLKSLSGWMQALKNMVQGGDLAGSP